MKELKKINYVLLLISTLFVFNGCDFLGLSSSETKEASSQKQFVWNAMNFWYYWQGEVADLSDNRFSNNDEFYSYLNKFENAKALFEELRFQEDDFSFFIDNYETFQQSQQGISQSFGYEYGLIYINQSSNDILGYVRYVVPDSPAQQAGLERGDLFIRVDGTQLNDQNVNDLLRGTTSYELSLAEIEDNTIQETGETVDLQAVTLQENPIYLSSVIDTAATSIGYLMYNAFQVNSHEQLNNIFGTYQSEGIDELVIDLRYNGGGAGITSQTLGSMISGLDDGNIFSQYAYNQKRSSLDTTVSFLETVPIFDEDGDDVVSEQPMNSLSLDRVYVLTGPNTASASEVLINGLEAYIDVVLIGRQTVGKDEGSYTLYDAPAPYLNEEEANPDHKMAIQPIILKVVNKNGREYPDGFQPDHEINELQYLENLPPLGDPDDPLLAKAIELITGQPVAKSVPQTGAMPLEFFRGSNELKSYSQGLYIDAKPLSEVGETQ